MEATQAIEQVVEQPTVVEDNVVVSDVQTDIEKTTEDTPVETTATTLEEVPTGDELVEALIETGFTEENVAQFETDLLTNGDLSEQSYALLAEKGLDGLARAYIKALAEITENASKQAVVDHFQEIEQYNQRVAESNDRILAELGGIEVVDQLIAFKNSLSAQEIKAFDEAAEQLGDTALKAFQDLQQAYELKYGSIQSSTNTTQSQALTASKPAGDFFSSDSEYRQALRDKRYGRDAEYSKQVRNKLENSILKGIISL